jgi:hypothetical protein
VRSQESRWRRTCHTSRRGRRAWPVFLGDEKVVNRVSNSLSDSFAKCDVSQVISTRYHHVRHPCGSAEGYPCDINYQSGRLINAVYPGKDEIRGETTFYNRHWLVRAQGNSYDLEWLLHQVVQPLLGAVKKVGDFSWTERSRGYPPALCLVEGNVVHLVGNILRDSID